MKLISKNYFLGIHFFTFFSPIFSFSEIFSLFLNFLFIFGRKWGKNAQMTWFFIKLIYNYKLTNITKPIISQKMPNALKPNLVELFKTDPVSFEKILHMDTRVLKKIINRKGTLHISTARTIMERLKTMDGSYKNMEDFFILSELKGYEWERKVIYEESSDLFSKNDWISIVRYVIEKRFDALTLLEVLLFLLLVGMVGFFVFYFFL